MKKEVWKDIKNYEGLYQVSNLGRIKSLKHGKERILKSFKEANGYLKICLCNNNVKKTFSIHKLVANTFLDNPKNHPVINHINGNKSDNRIINLEFCTYSYNSKQAYELGLLKRKYGKENPCAKKVCQYDKKGNFIKKWDSIIEASQKLGINHSHISECCGGKYKTTGGYVWRYY